MPAISGGRKRRFCSSLPNTTTGCSPKMFMCTAEAPLNPAPDCATACMTMAASVMPRPLPPYSSGIATPSQPASAIARWNSCGNAPSVSFCSQYSSPKRSHSRATASRISSCASATGGQREAHRHLLCAAAAEHSAGSVWRDRLSRVSGASATACGLDRFLTMRLARLISGPPIDWAPVAELADAHGSGPCSERSGGSNSTRAHHSTSSHQPLFTIN